MSDVDVVARHAYELARRACDGRRVAVIGEGEAAGASMALAGLEGAVVDPAAVADRFDGFDAAVLIRSHRDPPTSPDALAALGRLARAGVPVVVSAPAEPGDAGDAERGRRELEALLEAAERVTIVELQAASGSLIGPAGADEMSVALHVEEASDPVPAAHVAFANVDPPVPDGERGLRLAPARGPSLPALERSIRALERANRSLARPTLSRRTSAAASEIHRSTRLERRLLHLHRESPWVTLPVRIVRGMARRIRALTRLGR